eukprot:m51a1_g5052 hypothetical protein (446) ;mRNA; r:67383-69474
MKSVAALVLAVVACSASAFELQFVGNVSGVEADVDLHFRAAGNVDLDLLPGSVLYSLDARVAADVLANHDISAHAAADANGIWAYGGVLVPHTLPVAWYGMFNASARVGLDLVDFVKAGVEGSFGCMGMVYTGLVERDPSGNVVSQKSFVEPLLLGSGIRWSHESSGTSPKAPGAHHYRIVGRDSASSLTVAITYIMSSVAGVVDYGRTTVLPKVLETVVEIQNYPYADARNVLELRVVTASSGLRLGARAAVSTTGVQVFVDLKGSAVVDGHEAAVDISGWAAAEASALDHAVLAQLVARANAVVSAGDVKCAEATVKFDAGAKLIVYDPALGTGPSPYTSGARSAAPAVALAALAALALRIVDAEDSGEGNRPLTKTEAQGLLLPPPNVKCAEATVKFDAGAKLIVYDPTLGTGPSPYTSGAHSIAPAVALAALAALAVALLA